MSDQLIIPDPLVSYKDSYVLRSGSDAAEQTAEKHVRYLWMWGAFLYERRDKDFNSEIDVEEDFLKFRRYLKQDVGYAEGTIRNVTSAISKFFKIQRPNDPNPVEQWETSDKEGKWSVTTVKERENRGVPYLSKEEVKSLIEATESLRDRLICRLLVSTGVRVSELVTLRLMDVSPEEREISIWEDKNEVARDVGFRDDKLARDLRIWIDHGRAGQHGAEESDYLFPPGSPNGDSDHLHKNTARMAVRRAADKAGIQSVYDTDTEGRRRRKVGPHCLRATFAVQCAKAGISAPYVQEALGHSSLDVTQIYLNVVDGDAADVIREQGPAF